MNEVGMRDVSRVESWGELCCPAMTAREEGQEKVGYQGGGREREGSRGRAVGTWWESAQCPVPSRSLPGLAASLSSHLPGLSRHMTDGQSVGRAIHLSR